MGETFTICSTLAARQRAALEHLLYFNVNQERMRLGIQKSIDSYGVPEILENNGTLSIRVGSVEGVQTLFAVSEYGHPMGVAIFVRSGPERVIVLHLGVLPRLRSKPDVNAQVLLELVHEVHCAAKRMDGVDRVEVVYSQRCSPPQIAG
jgi:hypothetical protein